MQIRDLYVSIISFENYTQFHDLINNRSILKLHPEFKLTQLDFNVFAASGKTLRILDTYEISFDMIDPLVPFHNIIQYYNHSMKYKDPNKSLNEYSDFIMFHDFNCHLVENIYE